jgi:hypothetical protein
VAKLCLPATPTPAFLTDPALMRDELANATDHGFLWKLTKGGHSSYLYGTLHVGKPEWMLPGPQLSRAWRNTQLLAVEMRLDEAQKMFAPAPASDGGVPSPAAGPSANEVAVRQVADAMCLPKTAADMLARIPASAALGGLLALEAAYGDLWVAYGSELVLTGMAQSAKRDVVSLETMGEQTDAVGSLVGTDDGSVKRTAQAIAARAHVAGLQKLGDAWASGSLDALSPELMCPGCAQNEQGRAALEQAVTARNPHLADRAAKLHDEGKRVFIAVGALHMVGEQGLPALLAQRGFVVERIAFEP